ncbi:MAG: hypothetical protein IJN02_08620 [Bacteroidales bacterium]|nr:hypothetical protein [Bacteroidales bacterium]MBQ6689283.1 hypothetical protein [Bacteroidales bacterium]
MNRFEDDILQSMPQLKEMPYDLPEGYFDSLKKELQTEVRQNTLQPQFRQKLASYLSLAAMFVMIVAAGGFFLEKSTEKQELTQEDFLIFSDDFLYLTYYESDAEASAGIEEEDIIEYLIYTGVSADSIEHYKQ